MPCLAVLRKLVEGSIPQHDELNIVTVIVDIIEPHLTPLH